jgi:hypothetical protein
MRNFFLLIIGVAMFIGAVGYLVGPVNKKNGVTPLDNIIRNAKLTTMKIGDNDIRVEVVDSEATRRTGLAKYESLPEDQGMLFVFESIGKPTFWMKDMVFPIDIVWIENGKVAGIEHNVNPEPGVADDSLTRFNPPAAIRYVLEVNAGFAEANNILIGTQVALPEGYN